MNDARAAFERFVFDANDRRGALRAPKPCAKTVRAAFQRPKRGANRPFSGIPWLLLFVLAACNAGTRQIPAPLPLPPVIAPPERKEAPLARELVEFHSGARTLHGFLWRPNTPGRHPAIVFNHGSERLPGGAMDQAEFFVPHGFVVFVPHRRGHGRSADAGPYIGTMNGRARGSPSSKRKSTM